MAKTENNNKKVPGALIVAVVVVVAIAAFVPTVYMPYKNNINSINIKENEAKNNSNLHDLTIKINSETLNILSKSCLIDIIIFIRDICKVKIDQKFTHLKHQF